jgi:hypothetical protein
MHRRGVAAGVGLLLAMAACTNEPAPRPSPAPAPAPATATATACSDSIGQVTAPPEDYHTIAGVAALPDDAVIQTAPSGEQGPAVKLFAKWGLLVRTGETVEVAIGPGWASRARVGWGNPAAPAASVRIKACAVGGAPKPWTAFAGGTWVAEPACVPAVIRDGNRIEQIRLPIGRPCG